MIVSFIIPAYNAADTIVRCLESIRNLTLKKEDYEIIVIDDCSTDNTIAVIEKWRLKIGNLILIKQLENQRQGAARNRGVKEAKGDYICFVDADDEVTEGIAKAIHSAVDKKTDMTAYHYTFVNEEGVTTKEAKKINFEEGIIFSGIDLQNRQPYWCAGPVAYVYERAFLKRVNYPFVEGVLFEDADFVMTHLYYAKRMTYSSELGYKAYYREGSTTHSMTYKNVADYLLLGTRMLRLYELIKEERGKREVEGVEKFSETILEGACYNIERAFHYMPRLRTIRECKACYQRIDNAVDRKQLRQNKYIKKYYWRNWTKIGLYAPWLMMVLWMPFSIIYRKK